jgi:hypothetical protein
MSEETAYDWRKDYALCEHIARADAETAEKQATHSIFRVCCEACWRRGFLSSEYLVDGPDINGYATMEFPPQ